MTFLLDHAFTAPYEHKGETLCGHWFMPGEWVSPYTGRGNQLPMRCGYGPERHPKAGA